MKSKKKSILLIILAVLAVLIIGGVIYFMPTIKVLTKGGVEVPKEELDSATQDYMAIIESMNAQTGQPDNSSDSNIDENIDNSSSSADSKIDNSSQTVNSENLESNSISSDNNNSSSISDNSSMVDNQNPDNQNQGGNENINNEDNSSPVETQPVVTEPAKDYSQFIGTWKGYFGTEMSPTYELFNDLGFELITTNGSEITYTFWLTCNGFTKKLDNTYGKIDSNNRLNIIINGESAGLTMDLVFEDDGTIWGVVSNAYILNNPVTFPVIFFQK